MTNRSLRLFLIALTAVLATLTLVPHARTQSPDTATLTGRLIIADGSSPTELTVQLSDARERLGEYEVRPDATGRFAITAPHGAFYLDIAIGGCKIAGYYPPEPGNLWGGGSNVIYLNDEPHPPLALELPTSHTATVTINVSATPPQAPEFEAGLGQTYGAAFACRQPANGPGAFLLTALTGAYNVTILADHEPIGTYDPHSPGNFSPRRSSAASTFQLSALANAPIAIQIPHLATIHGRLLHHDGQPVANHGVILRNEQSYYGWTYKSTDAGGAFALTAPVGRHYIELDLPDSAVTGYYGTDTLGNFTPYWHSRTVIELQRATQQPITIRLPLLTSLSGSFKYEGDPPRTAPDIHLCDPTTDNCMDPFEASPTSFHRTVPAGSYTLPLEWCDVADCHVAYYNPHAPGGITFSWIQRSSFDLIGPNPIPLAITLPRIAPLEISVSRPTVPDGWNLYLTLYVCLPHNDCVPALPTDDLYIVEGPTNARQLIAYSVYTANRCEPSGDDCRREHVGYYDTRASGNLSATPVVPNSPYALAETDTAVHIRLPSFDTAQPRAARTRRVALTLKDQLARPVAYEPIEACIPAGSWRKPRDQCVQGTRTGIDGSAVLTLPPRIPLYLRVRKRGMEYYYSRASHGQLTRNPAQRSFLSEATGTPTTLTLTLPSRTSNSQPPLRLTLQPGYNLISWHGQEIFHTELCGASDTITAVTIEYHLDEKAQPELVSCTWDSRDGRLLGIDTGQLVWIYSAADMDRDISIPVDRANRLRLEQGTNFVAWPGPTDTSGADLVRSFGSLLRSALLIQPDLTLQPINDRTPISEGDLLLIDLAASIVWIPPVGVRNIEYVLVGEAAERQPTAIAERTQAIQEYFRGRYGVEQRQWTLFVSRNAMLSTGIELIDGVGLYPVGGFAGGNRVWIQNVARSHTLAHEYVHLLQQLLGRGIDPNWLVEGSAQYYAEEAVDHIDDRTGSGWQRRRATLVELFDADSSLDLNPYTLGSLATEYLVHHHGPDAIFDYWRRASLAPDWQTAFTATFGLTPEQFYEAFASYQAGGFLLPGS